MFILLGVAYVDGLMGSVEISTDHNLRSLCNKLITVL
jgi:hypothetical protein